MTTFKWMPTVILNTGCQFRFFPFYSLTSLTDFSLIDEVFWDDVEDGKFEERHRELHSNPLFTPDIRNALRDKALQGDWKSIAPGCEWVRYRLTLKHLLNSQGERANFLGIELAIETTSPTQNALKRGLCLNNSTAVASNKRSAPQYKSVYCDAKDGEIRQIKKISFELNEKQTSELLSVDVEIGFRQRIAQKPLDAHVVIDIGNTRTSAIVLKDNPAGILDVASMRSYCKPVLLNLPTQSMGVTRADISNVDHGIAGSWVMLHQPPFDTKKTVSQQSYKQEVQKRLFRKEEVVNISEEERLATMFVRYSPVMLGQEVKDCLSTKEVSKMIDNGLQIQQSSPKRYFADTMKTPVVWSMVPNSFAEMNQVTASPLNTPLLYWMNERGDYVNANTMPAHLRPCATPTAPNYPRCSTFVWMLVGILERAWEQCNHLTSTAMTFTPYQIKDVIVTYPSGWTHDEIKIYKQRCEDAVKIFEQSNFDTLGQIALNMDVDEAIASQLPYVFSEIHKFNDCGQSWIRLAGREREDGRTTFRIMNFDIGGGTSDVSIVEYECFGDNENEIQPALLYRDGYAEAGDELMRRIIEKVIFPCFDRLSQECKSSVEQYFHGAKSTPTLTQQCVRDLKLCIIPLAIQVMKQLASGTPSGHFTINDAGVNGEDWKYFKKNVGLQNFSDIDWENFQVVYAIDTVNKLIRLSFNDAFENVGKLAAQYDIDLFFLSGKTSELPELKMLAQDVIPITNDRIVCAKNYYAGDWYPFIKEDYKTGKIIDNTIRDAKSVTAVGAALNYMLSNGKISGWNIQKMRFAETFESEWGLLSTFQRPNGQAFIFNNEITDQEIYIGQSIIARRMTRETLQSAVYYLIPKNEDVSWTRDRFVARLKRCVDSKSRAEYLELVSLKKKCDSTDCKADYKLVVYQSQTGFWQDTGSVI